MAEEYNSIHTGAQIDAGVSAGRAAAAVTGILKGDGAGGFTAATVDSSPASGSSNPVTSGGVYTALAGKQAAAVTRTVTLAAAGWSGGSQIVTATGVTTYNIVFISPDQTDQAAYIEAGIVCTAQGANILTFTCTTTPTADIDVGVVIL